MPLPKPIALPLNLTAGVLETTAGVLRTIAGAPSRPRPSHAAQAAQAARDAGPTPPVPAKPSVPVEPSAPAAGVPKPPAGRGTKPAPATRSEAQISKPKAARKVRHRGDAA
jgi:hypothetical protein